MDKEKGLKIKYFTLKPNGTGPYAVASREALRAYAEAIKEDNANMSRDLLDWVEYEQTQAEKDASSPKLVQEGERFALPFWVDDRTWVYAKQRILNNQFYHYLLHTPSGLEATSNVNQSPYKACVELRKMIEEGLARQQKTEDGE